MYRKKVIIIGSGLGGLSCGFILQKNGYDVTILEQGAQIGGCLQCFTRHGAKFETGMHFIGSAAKGQTIYRMMNYLNMGDVSLSTLDTLSYDTIALCGEQFHFANGREPFIQQMSQRFPKETDNLVRYFNIIDKIAAASTLNSLTSASRDAAAATEYQTLSINEVLDHLFKDELLKKVLVGNLPLYAAELDKTPFSQHAFIMDFYNQSAFRIEGGSDAIASSLFRNIEQMGGRVLTRKKVRTIVCDDNHAVGIETDDDTYMDADYIISTIHPARMLEMLTETKLIRPAFRQRLNSIPNTTAGFGVYIKFKEKTMPYMNTNFYGYHGDTPWGCEHYTEQEWPKGFLYMHMCHQDKAQWAKSGVILSYMNMEDVQQWKGTAVGKRGKEYDAFKQEHAKRLIDEVGTHFPHLADAIEYYTTSTPLTYLNYTGTEGGSMYGAAKDISLGAAGRVPYRTKIPNLFLAGQNVNSHGVMGVLVGTIVTCSALVPVENIYKQIKEANKT